MPNNLNFLFFNNIKEIELNLDNWINPLFIQYVIETKDDELMCLWQIKGTFHTFEIPLTQLNSISGGDYKQHFSEFLSLFRDDYLTWKEVNFNTPWMLEYKQQYESFILDDEKCN